MLSSTIAQIKENLLYVLDEIVQSRQYLNKHFQNSMNNYFLENYATLSSLKHHFDTQSGRQVRKEVFEKYSVLYENDGMLKCFLTMKGFVEEHRLIGSLEVYRAALIALANDDKSDSVEKGTQEWISLQWRRVFSLMVLHHSYYLDIQGVYELWFHVFGDRLIARERQKKRKDELQLRKETAPYIILSQNNSKDNCANSQFHQESSSSTENIAYQGDVQQISTKKEESVLITKEKTTKKSQKISQKSKKTQVSGLKEQAAISSDKQDERISQSKINEIPKKEESANYENNQEEVGDGEFEMRKKRKTQDTIMICRDESADLNNNDNSPFDNAMSWPQNQQCFSSSQSVPDLTQDFKYEETHAQSNLLSNENQCNNDIQNYQQPFYQHNNFERDPSNNSHFQTSIIKQSNSNFPAHPNQLNNQFNLPNSAYQQTTSFKQQYTGSSVNYFSQEYPQNQEILVSQQNQQFQKQQQYSDYPYCSSAFVPTSNQKPGFFAPLFTLANYASSATSFFHYGYPQTNLSQEQLFKQYSASPNLQIENWMYHHPTQPSFSETSDDEYQELYHQYY